MMRTLAIAFLAAFAAAPAQATLVAFDIPGGGSQNGHGTYVNGVNISGDVTGNVIDDSGQSSGFVRDADGTVTVFTGAANADTHAIDIAGSTVNGYYTGADGHNHGFIHFLDGTITTFDPKHSTGTQSIATNRGHDIAGQFTDSSRGGLQRGFLRKARSGRFETFDGNPTARTFGTFVTGLSNTPNIVGFWFDASSAMHGFWRARNGFIVPIDIDGAGTGALQGTQPESVNLGGDIAGFYTDGSGKRHGFLRTRTGTVETFDAPGAVTTVVASINRDRKIAGYFIDASGIAHGFVRSRHGNFKVFDAPGAALEPSRGTFVSDINEFGAVSGEVYDHQFGAHGFEGTP